MVSKTQSLYYTVGINAFYCRYLISQQSAKPIIVLFYAISNLKLKVCKLFDWAYNSLVKCLYECCVWPTPASKSSMVAYDFNPITLKDEILGSFQV